MKHTLTLLTTLLLAPLAMLHAADVAAKKPNILLILTDDQGYGDFSLHGNPLLKTPNLDSFAREGLRFEQFQVSPFCSPTRASLLTGRYSLRTGVTSVTNNKEVMRHTEVTIAEALRSAGYRTGCFGKWHNGEQFPHNALGQGFDEFFGFNGGHFNHYFNSELVRGTKPERAKGFITDVLTDEAIAFMKRHRDQPFFCYLPYNAPHTPTQVPDRSFTEFKGQGLDDALAAIYGMCQNLDENFGRLMAALDELGIREDTLVLFLTDNGANGDRFNAGMRGWKTSVHEGGTRVPLFVQWPRRFKQPRVIQQLAAHLDLYPTLLELCEVTPPVGPAIDGISLVPWMNGRTDTIYRNVFVYSSQSTPARPFPGGVRTDRYRFVCEETADQVATAKWQLYDLKTDPGEKTDLAGQRPAVVAELARAYATWWSSVQGGYDPPHRIEVGHDIENPVTLHAPQAARWPGLTFARRLGQPNPRNAGFAQDWLTDWTRPEAMAEWAIEVMAPGRYAVELQCTVVESDAGARIRVSAAGSSTEGTTQAFPGRQIPLPHRDRNEQNTYVDHNIVIKLRRHPSLVLWAGNNENDQFVLGRGYAGSGNPGEDRISREVLPRVVWAWDPTRPYLPSSPYISDEVIKKGGGEHLLPEVHLWGPRGYYKTPYYSDVKAHFVSEIGYHGCPDRASLEQMFDQEHVYPWTKEGRWNEQWQTKAVVSDPYSENQRKRNDLMLKQVTAVFGSVSSDLDQFIFESQAVQAEAMKYFIELWRMDKFRKTGIIWWNLRDGWPIISDAVVDFYNRKKLAYWYIKRVQEDACVMIGDSAEGMHPVIAVNDTLMVRTGTIVVRDSDSGETIFEGNYVIPANGKAIVGHIAKRPQQAMWLIEYTIDGKKFSNHYLSGAAPFKATDYRRWFGKLGINRG